jgi:hypothetical protein
MRVTNAHLVQVWLEPHERCERIPSDPESVVLRVYRPNTFVTAAVLRRVPADHPDLGHGWARTPIDEHLVVGPEEKDPQWLSTADVIVTRPDVRESASDPANVLAKFPGCIVLASCHSGSSFVVESRIGWEFFLCLQEGELPATGDMSEYTSMYASLVHAWIAGGRSLAALATAAYFTVSGGPSSTSLRVWVSLGSRGLEVPVRRARCPSLRGADGWQGGRARQPGQGLA